MGKVPLYFRGTNRVFPDAKTPCVLTFRQDLWSNSPEKPTEWVHPEQKPACRRVCSDRRGLGVGVWGLGFEVWGFVGWGWDSGCLESLGTRKRGTAALRTGGRKRGGGQDRVRAAEENVVRRVPVARHACAVVVDLDSLLKRVLKFGGWGPPGSRSACCANHGSASTKCRRARRVYSTVILTAAGPKF